MALAVHHEIAGPADGPVVVLSHAIGADLRMWDPQVPALAAAGYRVLRYDHRGHGRSEVVAGPATIADIADDLLALLDRLDVPAAHVVGLSLGGMTGMWLARHAPERVLSLVLCCTSAKLGPPQMWADRAATVRAEGMAAVAQAAIGRWLTPDYVAGHPAEVRRLTDMGLATPPEGYASCCAAIETMDQEDGLGAITAPTLVISGADDPATPPEHGRRIADGIAGARLEVVEQAAHLGSFEQAERFTGLILGHLARAPYAAGMAVRRAVLGDAHVERAIGQTTAFSAPFQDYITASAWGSVWTRPGLDRRTRSCVTLAVLTALHCHEELAMHVRAAVRVGLTAEEIGEVLLHTAVYAGVPAANAAVAVAQRTLAELAEESS